MHQRDSIPITFAGPLSNLLLYSLSMSLIFIFGDIYFLNILSLINIILFIFNMLPIFPMDGGIILRDILMLKIDRRKGARISAWISMTTSVMLFIFSLIFGFIIMSLFSIYFIYSSYKILKK
jgi:stage IV sporulation protein FB